MVTHNDFFSLCSLKLIKKKLSLIQLFSQLILENLRKQKEDLGNLTELSKTVPNDPELESLLPDMEQKIATYAYLAEQGIDQIQVSL